MKASLANYGPVNVAVDASYWHAYKGGIMTDKDCHYKAENHEVIACGYGYDEESGKEFIKIKNSWGESWGEEGFIRLEATNTKKGVCGVYNDATELVEVKYLDN